MIYQDIHTNILKNSRRFGPKDYLVSVDQGKSITFEQINEHTGKVANYLASEGLRKGDRVSLIGKNSIETITIFLGVMRYGSVINPINFEESPENIFRIVRRVKPCMIIYDRGIGLSDFGDTYLAMPFAAMDDLEKEKFDFFSIISGQKKVFESPLGSKEDVAEILFTSGTTEEPKGVIISREGLFFMVDEVIRKIALTEKDRVLEYRAYSWASTQLLTILSTLRVGATLILSKKFSRSRFAGWLKGQKVTISSGVPTVINILLSNPVRLRKEDVPQLKYITSSSAPLSVEKQMMFEQIYGIRINQMAGMTEAGWMMGNPPGKSKTGSVGTPFAHKQVLILDENGRECGVGQEGEIVIRGRSMAMGYLNEKGGIDLFPKDGFPTGDIGFIDDDGYIFISGRKKDLIIRGGVNISPREITDRIMQHPGVREATTVGVTDKIYGEEIACFVVPTQKGKVSSHDLLTHCKKTLPEFKIPKILRFVDKIPKTERGKVSKKALLEMLTEEES
jgi:acyl-coenzyme A synthetase/AMP-(fatty) acid ligase